MKCDNCGLRVETLRMVCEPCYLDIKNKPDEDLRDEVAKEVLPVLLSKYGVDEAVAMSFDVSRLWMAERARRREGR